MFGDHLVEKKKTTSVLSVKMSTALVFQIPSFINKKTSKIGWFSMLLILLVGKKLELPSIWYQGRRDLYSE